MFAQTSIITKTNNFQNISGSTHTGSGGGGDGGFSLHFGIWSLKCLYRIFILCNDEFWSLFHFLHYFILKYIIYRSKGVLYDISNAR